MAERNKKKKGVQKKNLRGSIKVRRVGTILRKEVGTVEKCQHSGRPTTTRAILNGVTIPLHPKFFGQAPNVFRQIQAQG
jgi:hypothetical protein